MDCLGGVDPSRKGALSVTELHRFLLNWLSSGSLSQQEIAVMALGNCNPESYERVAKELQVIMKQEQVKERSRGKQAAKSRMEETRLNTANVFRIISDQMPRGTLRFRKDLREKFLDFIDNTLHFVRQLGPMSTFECIAQLPPEYVPQDMLHLCYCLASVAANAGAEMICVSGQEGLNIELRRVFFNTLQQWNSPPGEASSNVAQPVSMM